MEGALEDAVQSALKDFFHPLGSTSNARDKFYNKFKREAEDYDKEFSDKYGGDLDTTLIFAALFSAVVSAFIIAIQTQLQPDYTQLSYDLLWMMANSTHQNPPPKPSSDSPWAGPDPGLANVQAILFSSLALSLLASFVAMLGKQWLSCYSQVDMRGSPIDRSRDRQRKMNGMIAWGFTFVMESLPLMLQAALLLLGCALSKYLFTIDNHVAWVVVVFTAAGFVFYLSIVVAATISRDCPFQTPLSRFFRFAGTFFDERKYLGSFRTWFLRTFKRRRRQPGEPFRFTLFCGPDGNNFDEGIQLAIVGPSRSPPVLFGHVNDQKAYVLDSNCIAWMFEMSMDPDVILDVMKFIPEIIWHNDIHTTPLEKLYDTVLECFDHSSGRPVVASKFKDKAYPGAKALLHIGIQRKCMGIESDTTAFNYIACKHRKNLGSRYFEVDPDLDSTLAMIDRVFVDTDFEPIPWEEFTFTDPHHTWMSRVLLCHAWGALKKGDSLPEEVRGFVRHSLALVPPPPVQIVRDCLYVVDLILKTRLDDDDPHVIGIGPQINRIYNMLDRTFRNTSSTLIEIDTALEAMRLTVPLTDNDIAARSYGLFRIIMKALASPSPLHSERKWEASRLALHGAYKPNKFLPWVEDPQDILAFLSHYFELVEKGEDHGEPIQSALRALAYAPSPKTIEALKDFDSTKPSFVCGIGFAFRDTRPRELRKAALFFLPLIADKWFSSSNPIMTPKEMECLCVDWASAVDQTGTSTHPTQRVALAVLLNMIDSPHWRPHIVPEKWKLLGCFTSAAQDDSPALRRCLDNAELVGEISNMGKHDVITLWSTILWLKYSKLKPEVQGRLQASARKEDVDRYLLVIESDLKEAEEALLLHGTWSDKPEAVVLKEKIDSHKVAIGFLKSLKRGYR